MREPACSEPRNRRPPSRRAITKIPPLRHPPKSTENFFLDFLGGFMHEIGEAFSGLKPKFEKETPYYFEKEIPYYGENLNRRKKGFLDELFGKPPEQPARLRVRPRTDTYERQNIDDLNSSLKAISESFGAIRTSLAIQDGFRHKPVIIKRKPEPSTDFFDAIAEILFCEHLPRSPSK